MVIGRFDSFLSTCVIEGCVIEGCVIEGVLLSKLPTVVCPVVSEFNENLFTTVSVRSILLTLDKLGSVQTGCLPFWDG